MRVTYDDRLLWHGRSWCSLGHCGCLSKLALLQGSVAALNIVPALLECFNLCISFCKIYLNLSRFGLQVGDGSNMCLHLVMDIDMLLM